MKRKPKRFFSKRELRWLKTNFPILGCLACSERLGINKDSLLRRMNKMNIYVDRDILKERIAEQNYNNFIPKYNLKDWINVKKPEIAYILGLLWADGYIQYKRSYAVRIHLVKEDFDKIIWIFDNVATWHKRKEKRSNLRHQIMLDVRIFGRDLVKYLISKDYHAKSYKSAQKILKTIPKHLKHYFFRGLFDGDGTISKDEFRLKIFSGYNQDWNFMPKYFNKYKWMVWNGGGSCAAVSNKKDLLRFGEFIYKNADKDKMYLPRKYKRYLHLKNK